ncbi:MAG: hypothetical protein K6E98_03585 [Lachnospiraceae bacterium]|nr:hypothetical protein [Lachnospiraceae bacterium]
MNKNDKKNDKKIIKLFVNIFGTAWVLLAILLLIPEGISENNGLKAKPNEKIDKGSDSKVLGTRIEKFFNISSFFPEDGETADIKDEISEIPGNTDDPDDILNREDAEGTLLKDEDTYAFSREEKDQSKNGDKSKVTVMIYMIGSDLESKKSEATMDISEMLASGIGNNVNVLIETLGTRKWNDYGIASDHTQIHSIENGELKLVKDDLGQLDSTKKETLAEFVGYCADNYTADRYILLFWDHGAGPVYGFGYDEWQDEEASLTLDEIMEALAENREVKFDIIGMDCCVMANIETALALKDYCKYSVLSEDFVSSIGWDYESWMSELEKNPDISALDLGKLIIDKTVADNEIDPEGRSTTMVMVDESKAMGLFNAWKDYAYLNENKLLALTKSVSSKGGIGSSIRSSIWKTVGKAMAIEDYNICDVSAVMEKTDNTGAKAGILKEAKHSAICHFKQTGNEGKLNGISVCLPWGDIDFYNKLYKVYNRCGFDEDYIRWLEKFAKESETEPGTVNGEGPAKYTDTQSYAGNSSSDVGNTVKYTDKDYVGLKNDDSPKAETFEYKYIVGNWQFDTDENVWYFKDGDILYLYDEDSKLMYYYDDRDGTIYYYDEYKGDWLIWE